MIPFNCLILLILSYRLLYYSVCYIPASDAEVYHDTLRIQSLALPSSTTTFSSTTDDQHPIQFIDDTAPAFLDDEEQALVERSELQMEPAGISPILTPTTTHSSFCRTPADGQESSSRISGGTAIITRKVSPVPPQSTTTVFIGGSSSSTGADILPQATQPTVQKRVVTHVTIFPSPPPPPDLIQVVRPPKSIPSSLPSTEQLSEDSHSASLSASAQDHEGVEVEAEEKAATKPSAPIPPPKRGLTPSSSIENTLSVSASGDIVVTKEKEASSEELLSQSVSGSRSTPTPKGSSGGAGTGTGGSAGSGDEGQALLLAKHWGPERLVEVQREAGKSLGISIVGGKVDLYNAGHDSGSAISGIFIKNVLLNSPAGRTSQLKTGDRILAVDDVDLRSASHEKAVDVIRAAGNPVRFLVQSLVQWADGRGGVSIGVTIANHEDSEASERSEGTETKSQSQSVSQTVQSQSQESCSTGTTSTTGTETGESGSRSYTTTTTSSTHTTTGESSTNGGDNTQRRRSGIPPGGDSLSEASAESQIERGGEDDVADAEFDELEQDQDVDHGHGLLVKVAVPTATTERTTTTPSPDLIQ